MMQIFTETTTVLAAEFVNWFIADNLVFTLDKVGQETGVKYERQRTNFVIMGGWKAIADTHTALERLLQNEMLQKGRQLREVECPYITNIETKTLPDQDYPNINLINRCSSKDGTAHLNDSSSVSEPVEFYPHQCEENSQMIQNVLNLTNPFHTIDVKCSKWINIGTGTTDENILKKDEHMELPNISSAVQADKADSHEVEINDDTIGVSDDDVTDIDEQYLTVNDVYSTNGFSKDTLVEVKTEETKNNLYFEQDITNKLVGHEAANRNSEKYDDITDINFERVKPISAFQVDKAHNHAIKREIVTTDDTAGVCDDDTTDIEEQYLTLKGVYSKTSPNGISKDTLVEVKSEKKNNDQHSEEDKVNKLEKTDSKIETVRKQKQKYVRKKKSKKEENLEYHCELCTYVGKRKEHLKFHVRRKHETNKKFSCDFCEKKYAFNHDLTRHKKDVHSDRNGTTPKKDVNVEMELPRSSITDDKTEHHDSEIEREIVKTDYTMDVSDDDATDIDEQYLTEIAGHPKTTTVTIREDQLAKDKIEMTKDEQHVGPVITNKQVKHGTARENNTGTDEKTYINIKKGKLQKWKKQIEKEVNIEYPCKMCSYIGKLKKNLKVHFKRQHDPKIFKCDICVKQFGFNNDLIRHKKDAHGDRFSGLCRKCNKFYTNRKAYLAHIKTHEDSYVQPRFGCEICKKTFTSKVTVARHTDLIHRGIKTEAQFICALCGKIFKSKASYLVHVDNHAGIKHICDVCGELNVWGWQNLSCSWTSKALSGARSLAGHMFLHDDVKQFQCDVCEKKFRTQQTLRMHEKVHSNVKNHKCVICGKGFGFKHSLIRHERIHNGDKPFLCTLCSRTFNDHSIVRRHMMLIHNMDSTNWKTKMKHLKNNIP